MDEVAVRFGVSAAQRSVWLGRFMAVPVDWVGRPPRRDEMDLTRWQRAIVGSKAAPGPSRQV